MEACSGAIVRTINSRSLHPAHIAFGTAHTHAASSICSHSRSEGGGGGGGRGGGRGPPWMAWMAAATFSWPPLQWHGKGSAEGDASQQSSRYTYRPTTPLACKLCTHRRASKQDGHSDPGHAAALTLHLMHFDLRLSQNPHAAGTASSGNNVWKEVHCAQNAAAAAALTWSLCPEGRRTHPRCSSALA